MIRNAYLNEFDKSIEMRCDISIELIYVI